MCCCRGAYYLIQTFHLSNWKKENSLIEIEANSAWCKKRDLCVCVQATSCLTRSLSPQNPTGFVCILWLSHSTTFPWLVYFLCALSYMFGGNYFHLFPLFIHAPLQSRNWHYSTFLPASNDERGEVPIIFPFSVRIRQKPLFNWTGVMWNNGCCTLVFIVLQMYDVALFILGWKKCIVKCWTELFDSRCGIHLVKNTMISVESIRWYIDHSLLCFIKWNSVTTSVQHTWRVAQELIISLCLSFHSNCSRVTFSFVVILIFSLVHSSDNTYLSVLAFLKFQSWRNFLTAPKFVFLSVSMHSSTP